MRIADRTGGSLLVIGSIVFLIGAAIGVPGVFTESDPQARLQMLTDRLRAWQIAQPLDGLGPGVAVAGVAFLAAASDGGSRVLLAVSCGTLAVGALSWAWSVYVRGTRVSEFASGALPTWPFAAYVLLTITGIAFLALALLIGDSRTWLGWVTLGVDVVFLVAYLRFEDIPPFVFYLLLIVVGLAVL